MAKIILFDGNCNFCNQNILFIIKRDKHNHFKFCSLQNETASTLLNKYNIPLDENSLVLIEDVNAYTKSTAALRISRHLTFPWKLLYCLTIIPKPLRDFIYTIVANNRYKIVKQRNKCIIPTNEVKKKFL